jgi:hypothetical protein
VDRQGTLCVRCVKSNKNTWISLYQKGNKKKTLRPLPPFGSAFREGRWPGGAAVTPLKHAFVHLMRAAARQLLRLPQAAAPLDVRPCPAVAQDLVLHLEVGAAVPPQV